MPRLRWLSEGLKFLSPYRDGVRGVDRGEEDLHGYLYLYPYGYPRSRIFHIIPQSFQ